MKVVKRDNWRWVPSGSKLTDRRSVREWRWTPPPGWPVVPEGYIPDARFWPDVDRLPGVPPEWSFWEPVDGIAEHDVMELQRVGVPTRTQSPISLPPEPPTEPPMMWVAPPNWPPVPPGWVPPVGWKRPRQIPREPRGWQFWQPDLREHQAHIERWRDARNETLERLSAHALGLRSLLNLVEGTKMLRCAKSSLLRRPIPTLAHHNRGDIPPQARNAQIAAHQECHDALSELRQRVLYVARGEMDLQAAHVASYGEYCARLLAEAHRADIATVTAAMEPILRTVRLAAQRPPAPVWQRAIDAGQLALERGQAELAAIYEKAVQWAGTSDQNATGHILTWKDAEVAAAQHMCRVLGFSDAVLTGPGTDNGIDVKAMYAVAQVKNLSQPVGQPDLQRLVGANELGKTMLFYSSSGYSRQACDYAERIGIALFRFDPPGAPAPVSSTARRLLSR